LNGFNLRAEIPVGDGFPVPHLTDMEKTISGDLTTGEETSPLRNENENCHFAGALRGCAPTLVRVCGFRLILANLSVRLEMGNFLDDKTTPPKGGEKRKKC
jgi:hypothetical protein